MDDIATLEQQAKEAEAKARAARAAVAAAQDRADEARMEPLKKLAARAHDALCQYNHTDGCSWGYEEGAPDPWRCDAHTRWLRRYDRLINGTNYDRPVCTLVEAETVIAAVEGLKPKVRTALSLLRSHLTP